MCHEVLTVLGQQSLCPAAPSTPKLPLGSVPVAQSRRGSHLCYSEHFLGFIVFPSLSHLPRRKPLVPMELPAPCPAGRHSRTAPHHVMGRGMAGSQPFPLLAAVPAQQDEVL